MLKIHMLIGILLASAWRVDSRPSPQYGDDSSGTSSSSEVAENTDPNEVLNITNRDGFNRQMNNETEIIPSDNITKSATSTNSNNTLEETNAETSIISEINEVVSGKDLANNTSEGEALDRGTRMGTSDDYFATGEKNEKGTSYDNIPNSQNSSSGQQNQERDLAAASQSGGNFSNSSSSYETVSDQFNRSDVANPEKSVDQATAVKVIVDFVNQQQQKKDDVQETKNLTINSNGTEIVNGTTNTTQYTQDSGCGKISTSVPTKNSADDFEDEEASQGASNCNVTLKSNQTDAVKVATTNITQTNEETELVNNPESASSPNTSESEYGKPIDATINSNRTDNVIGLTNATQSSHETESVQISESTINSTSDSVDLKNLYEDHRRVHGSANGTINYNRTEDELPAMSVNVTMSDVTMSVNRTEQLNSTPRSHKEDGSGQIIEPVFVNVNATIDETINSTKHANQTEGTTNESHHSYEMHQRKAYSSPLNSNPKENADNYPRPQIGRYYMYINGKFREPSEKPTEQSDKPSEESEKPNSEKPMNVTGQSEKHSNKPSEKPMNVTEQPEKYSRKPSEKQMNVTEQLENNSRKPSEKPMNVTVQSEKHSDKPSEKPMNVTEQPEKPSDKPSEKPMDVTEQPEKYSRKPSEKPMNVTEQLVNNYRKPSEKPMNVSEQLEKNSRKPYEKPMNVSVTDQFGKPSVQSDDDYYEARDLVDHKQDGLAVQTNQSQVIQTENSGNVSVDAGTTLETASGYNKQNVSNGSERNISSTNNITGSEINQHEESGLNHRETLVRNSTGGAEEAVEHRETLLRNSTGGAKEAASAFDNVKQESISIIDIMQLRDSEEISERVDSSKNDQPLNSTQYLESDDIEQHLLSDVANSGNHTIQEFESNKDIEN